MWDFNFYEELDFDDDWIESIICFDKMDIWTKLIPPVLEHGRSHYGCEESGTVFYWLKKGKLVQSLLKAAWRFP